MSRKSRTAAPPWKKWRGLPTELPDALYTVSFFSRATAVELFRSASARTDDYTGRLSTSGDWMDWILGRVLGVDGKQRNNIKRNLRELNEAGVIQVGDGFITVCVGQPLDGARPDTTEATSPDARPDFAPTSPLLRPDLAIESSNCNHYIHDSQNRTEQNRTKESERERTRERSADFEKPPLPEPPPELPPPELEPTGWLSVWRLYGEQLGLDALQLGHPARFRDALQAVSAAAEVESGGSEGVEYEKAVRRLLGAWSADKWVREKQPTIANLAANLHRYARAKVKPVVKLVGAPLKASDVYSDADLLAWPADREWELHYMQKQRRWELQLRREREEDARAASGGGS